MPEKTFDIGFRTSADNAAAQATQEAIAGVTASTRELTEAEREQIAANAGGQRVTWYPMVNLDALAKEKEELTSIQRQREEILELVEEQVRLAAQGLETEAAEMGPIIEARKLALTMQQQLGAEEIEANVRAEALVALKAAAAAQDKMRADALVAAKAEEAEQDRLSAAMEESMAEIEEQRLATEAAITEEKAAQNSENEASTLRGVGSVARGGGMLASGLGLGSLAGSIGFAIFGLMEGIRYIHEWIAGFDKANEASDKIGESITEYNSKLAERITLAQTDAEQSEIKASIEQQITKYRDEASGIEEKIGGLRGAQRADAQSSLDLLNEEINGLNQKLSLLQSITEAQQDQTDAQPSLSDVLAGQDAAYDKAMGQGSDAIAKDQFDQMDTREKLAALQQQRGQLPGMQYFPEGAAPSPSEMQDKARSLADSHNTAGAADVAQSAVKAVELDRQIRELKKQAAEEDARVAQQNLEAQRRADELNKELVRTQAEAARQQAEQDKPIAAPAAGIADRANQIADEGFAPEQDVQAVHDAANALAGAKGADDFRVAYGKLASVVGVLVKNALDLTDAQRDTDQKLADQAAQLEKQAAAIKYNRQ